MSRASLKSLSQAATWTCRRCQSHARQTASRPAFRTALPFRPLSTSAKQAQEAETLDSEISQTGFEVTAAPPVDFSKLAFGDAARVVPASASYFTTAPIFNDHILRLTRLVDTNSTLPLVNTDQAPRIVFMTLAQFRSGVDEKVGAAKYARLLELLKRLSMIHPDLRPEPVRAVLEEFRRPGSAEVVPAKPKFIDQFGRAGGVGRRKTAVARVQLIEGSGEVIVNGKSLAQAFPRLHDRESVVWPLKVTDRLNKYNMFVVSSGGGITGQAEATTLALANALMIHEPALKPALRKGKLTEFLDDRLLTFIAGCVTRVMKRVERKKTGRVKARKRPAWVKR